MIGLKAMSQLYLLNAFHELPFNVGNNRGIHGACPSDMLHAILLGIFKYVRDTFFDRIGGMPAGVMNGLSKQYCKLLRRQSDRTIPEARFSKGIKEGKLMGKDYRAIMLLILLLLQSKAGGRVLKESRNANYKEDEKVKDWALLVELILLWEAYLSEPEMEVKTMRNLEQKHRHIMYLIRKVAPRRVGMSWKLVKFHAILHLKEDILLFGVPLEFDTGANESHHKPMKAAGKLTQKRHTTFNLQTAQRLMEFMLIDFAMLEIEKDMVVWEYFDNLLEENWCDVNQEEGCVGSEEAPSDRKES